jgi:hypothetical protein
VLFDMDGVVTRTAQLHTEAWKELFDDFLRRRAVESGEPFEPFDPEADYLAYVDGKPRPAPFLKAAERLGVAPGRTLVIEDAVSGVEAGRRGAFGLVVGVDRGGNRAALTAHGADLVVADLGELTVADLDAHLRDKHERITAWQIEQEGFDSAREHEMESIFTVGNGYLGVRGALDTPLPGSQADLFIAGVYDRKQPERTYSELEFLADGRDDYPYSELVTFPFPVHRFTTQASGFEICLAARTTLAGSGKDAVRWRVPGTIGETLTFNRYVVIYTNRDVDDPHRAATERARALRWEDFDTALAAHVECWERIWERADIRIAGSPATEQALRFERRSTDWGGARSSNRRSFANACEAIGEVRTQPAAAGRPFLDGHRPRAGKRKGASMNERRGIDLVKIAGIQIAIDYSWLVIFVLVLWSLSAGYFPYHYPGDDALQ